VKYEIINTTWAGIEAARAAFPLEVPVETISGEVCTATEYREVMGMFGKTLVQVWGTVNSTKRYRVISSFTNVRHGLRTDDLPSAMEYARSNESAYCVLVEDREEGKPLYLKHCDGCTCERPAPEVG
jgi:hypothetical protein